MVQCNESRIGFTLFHVLQQSEDTLCLDLWWERQRAWKHSLRCMQRHALRQLQREEGLLSSRYEFWRVTRRSNGTNVQGYTRWKCKKTDNASQDSSGPYCILSSTSISTSSYCAFKPPIATKCNAEGAKLVAVTYNQAWGTHVQTISRKLLQLLSLWLARGPAIWHSVLPLYSDSEPEKEK